MDFYMMVGVPGSGKTTYANKLPYTKVFSSDDVRRELGVDGGNKRAHARVFDILHDRIRNALSTPGSDDIVYDATNIRAYRRFAFLHSIQSFPGRKICVYFDLPMEHVLRQNTERDDPVPENVIWNMHQSMEAPSADEGWDAIVVIRKPPHS